MKWGMLAILILVIPIATAQSGSMPLLAVSEISNNTYIGHIAALYLDIERGQDKVFLETFPASKLDTQLSTRFAKSIACSYTEEHCEDKNFFYSIRSGSSIIGGPSAGAASTILTISLLKDINLRDDVVITGTINSGGIIGPVGGIKEKIEVAAKHNISIVLIPMNSRIHEEDNTTIDLVEYGNQLNITVKEVATLEEAFFIFTQQPLFEDGKDIEINEEYTKTMDLVSAEMCARSNYLKERVENISFINDSFSAFNKTEKGIQAYTDGRLYSAASYCFSANIEYTATLLREKNLTRKRIAKAIAETDEKIRKEESALFTHQPKTMTDLQATAIVRSRLREARTSIDETSKKYQENDSDVIQNLAYTIERFNSAISWSQFIGKNGKRLSLTEDVLKGGCVNRLNEAQQHLQYAEFLFGISFEELQKEMNEIRILAQKDSISCLYEASLIKARVNVLLSAIGINDTELDELVDLKLGAAQRAIVRQQEKNNFPIAGYSYYEYAQSLQEDEPGSALLYAEFALELSDLDIYFPKERRISFPEEVIVSFFSGFVIGVLSLLLIYVLFFKKGKKKKN